MTEGGGAAVRFGPALRALLHALPARRKRQLGLLTLLALATAAADLWMVSAGLGFVSSLAGPTSGAGSSPLQGLGDDTQSVTVTSAAILFAIAAVVANLSRLAQLRGVEFFVATASHELRLEVQRRVLGQPFAYHTAHHSSEAIGALEKVSMVATLLLQQWLQGVAAIATGLSLAALLVSIDPLPAAATILALVVFYLVVARLAARRLRSNAAIANTAYDQRMRKLQESLSSIRDIKLDHMERACLDDFRRPDAAYARVQASTGFISGAPRHIIEAGAAVMIAALATWLAGGGRHSALMLVGGLALGGVRALPLLQAAYRTWAVITANRDMTGEVVRMLSLPVPDDEGLEQVLPAPFSTGVSLEGIWFRYPGRCEPALADIGLTIARGSRLGLGGDTGSGKSTLIDLLMGLLQPSEGRILVDGRPLGPEEMRSWQRNIAHVAQSVVLADDSIARNIAFSASGEPNIERVRQAAEAACISDFIATLPDGFDTRVGERGVQLSGGQRQRIAIARALYKGAPLLVLDEATNALDEATEARVLANLFADAERTILIVAHRPATLASCDRIVILSAGRTTSDQTTRSQ